MAGRELVSEAMRRLDMVRSGALDPDAAEWEADPDPGGRVDGISSTGPITWQPTEMQIDEGLPAGSRSEPDAFIDPPRPASITWTSPLQPELGRQPIKPLAAVSAKREQRKGRWGMIAAVLLAGAVVAGVAVYLQQDSGGPGSEGEPGVTGAQVDTGQAQDAVEVAPVLPAQPGPAQAARKAALDRALRLMAEGQAEQATDILAPLYAVDGADPYVASTYGRALIATKRPKRAEEVLQKLTADQPSHADGHAQLGRLYRAAGRNEEATTELRKGLKLGSTSHGTRIELAKALLAMGGERNVEEAQAELREVVASYERGEVPPAERLADANAMRGAQMLEATRWGGALKEFDAALAIEPGRQDAVMGKARAQFEFGRYDEAAALFGQAVRQEPDNPDARFYLGKIAMRGGDLDVARGHFEAVVKREPRRFPEAFRQLGMIYRDRGLPREARKAFETFLSLATPGSAEAEDVKRMLERMK
jgi:tetratricopeptide (TPR) repeat protein